MRVLGLSLVFLPLIVAAKTMPLHLVNDSGFEDEKVYLLIKALDPQTHEDCFMKLDLATGEGTCEAVVPNGNSQGYSYSFDQISHLSSLQIPQVISGRIYVSVGYPLSLHVNSADGKIIDTDGFKARDPNYYILHDKVEFSYNHLGTWFNPTAVDFFSLPLRVEQPGAATHIKAAGLSGSFQSVFNQLSDVVTENDTTLTQEWNKLFITFEDTTPMRFIAPGKAMVQNIPGTNPFDDEYLNNESSYGFNYIDNLWDYYKTNTLRINASELANPPVPYSYILTGQVDENDEFVFTTDEGEVVAVLDKPETSCQFFAGAACGANDSFDHVNNTEKAIVVRQLTSAFIVGLLPAPDGAIIDHDYFVANKGSYYSAPTNGQGPWYDLYGKALHSFGEDQPIYAFAYDDALVQDGTMHDPNVENISPVTITLNDMTGVKIPDPFTDETTYSVTVYVGKNSVVEYQGRAIESGETINNVSMPMPVEVNGIATNIYVKHPMVLPYFEGADGVVIDKTADNQATVIFPGR